MTEWTSGWQGGLFAGAAFVLALEVVGRWVLHRIWLYRTPRCAYCDGELGADGRALFPVERLHACDACGDTRPGPTWWGAKQMEARDDAVRAATAALDSDEPMAMALAGRIYWLVQVVDRMTPPSPGRLKGESHEDQGDRAGDLAAASGGG